MNVRFLQKEECLSVGILYQLEGENEIGTRKWGYSSFKKISIINEQFLSIFQMQDAGDTRNLISGVCLQWADLSLGDRQA